MKRSYQISLFTFFILIAAVFNSFGQCAANNDFEQTINLNSNESDCLKFKPTDLNNLLGLGAKKINPSSEVFVQGTPSIVEDKGSKENGFQYSWKVGLQINCSGAASPRIGYGPTRLYFAAPFEKDGSFVEFSPGRSFGYGESDQPSVSLLSTEFVEGGARVFPMTEFVRCDDRGATSGSKMIENIKGKTVVLQPKVSFMDKLRFARSTDDPKLDPDDKRFVEDSDVEVDLENIPTNKFLLQCFLLSIHPKGNEEIQLIRQSASGETVVRTFKENDGQSSCEVFTLDKPGSYNFKAKFLPYNVESLPIVLTKNAVKK